MPFIAMTVLNTNNNNNNSGNNQEQDEEEGTRGKSAR